MTSREHLRQGIVTYINREVAPKAPKALGIGIVAFGPVIVEAKLNQFLTGGLLEGTPLQQENTVDVDQVYQLLKPAAAGKWPIELFGIQFYEPDLDKAYRFIKEAETGAY